MQLVLISMGFQWKCNARGTHTTDLVLIEVQTPKKIGSVSFRSRGVRTLTKKRGHFVRPRGASPHVRWPGVVAPGSRSAALVSYVDVVPTFVDVAGGQPEKIDFDGRSFAPLLRGERDHHASHVFATHTTRGIHGGAEAYATRAVTDGRWLYIRNLHHTETFHNVITGKDRIFRSWKSVESDFARARVAAYQRRPAEELYDLKADPWCLKNISAGHTERRGGLSRQLDRWMEKQGDKGDATERAAKERQPAKKPWGRNGSYSLPTAP